MAVVTVPEIEPGEVAREKSTVVVLFANTRAPISPVS